MHKRTYAKNAAVLTATGLILRAAGMFFRIYIAARIGASGMGLFQLISTVYTLFVTFATAGLSVVATRITTESMVPCRGGMAGQEAGSVRTGLARVVLMGLCLGSFAACAEFISAPWVAVTLLKDAAAVLPLQILAPSLPFMAVSAVLRGYFLAVKRVGPNARAQMFEQVVRIGIVMGLLYVFKGADTATAVSAVVVGNTISEALSWVYMHLSYRRAVHRLPKAGPACGTGEAAGMLAPIAAGQYVTGVLRTIENVVVPVCLALFLGSRAMAVEQYGALKGMAMPVLFFPFSFISTLATLLLPDITSAFVQKQTTVLRRLVSRVLLMTLSVSILAGGMYTVFSGEIAEILYHDAQIGFYLRILGPLTPFMYLESMVDGILKGMNEQVATFRYTLVDCAVRIVLILLLLPRMGMQGFLFVMLVSNLLTSLLNLRRLLRVANMQFAWRQWLLGPLAAAIGACGIWMLAVAPLLPQAAPLLLRTAAGGCIFAAAYAVLLPLCAGVNLARFFSQKT